MSKTKHVPDIMEVITDLSNDEVRTPPRVANQVLDLLPDEVWSNSTYRWLDPGTKSGVFLREATKRLMVGLKEEFPDEQQRLEHILRNQMFGIAVTELSGLMARRAVYCSKEPTKPDSAVKMSSGLGNIWSGRVSHVFVAGKCSECGAGIDKFGKLEGENYAYAFIHSNGLKVVEEFMSLKFDVIVGNPPYQMESDGSNRTLPLYNLFVEQAISLNPKYISMITPSRWMAGGLGLGTFRSRMLEDTRIKSLVDFPNANEIFPGVEIKGGVSYFFWDSSYSGLCEVTQVRGESKYGPVPRQLSEFDVFVRDSRGLEILHKVISQKENSIIDILAADKEFGLTSNFKGYKSQKFSGALPLYINQGGKRQEVWMKSEDITKSRHLINTWKVLIPKAGSDGGQKIPDVVLGSPFVVGSPSVCTQTYLFVFVDSEKEAKNVESYIRTKFVRFLISLRKISQDATRSTYTWVPLQDWTIEWTDELLFEKYNIDEGQQLYISEMVKELPSK